MRRPDHEESGDAYPRELLGDEIHLARIFRWFIGVALVTVTVGIAIVLSFGETQTALILGLALPLILLSLLFVRKKGIEGAAVYLALVLISMITLVSTLGLGIHTVGNLAYPTILILVSLVTRRRTMILLTLTTIASLAWLVFGEVAGIYRPEALERSLAGDFYTSTVIIAVTAVIMRFVSEAMFRSNRRLELELEQRRKAEERLARDMATRLVIEGRLREALEEKTGLLLEKDLLLKEVHHRVKNNMQVVASILSLQADSLEDPATVAILRESQNRVFSLSLVHEQLYQSNNLARIDFREYLQHLSLSLAASYDTCERKVEFDFRITEQTLGVEQAIPCGLIVNELVSNCLKHAFPDHRTGKVKVGFVELPEGGVELSVEDDGVGFPEGRDWRRTESLGMQLVQSLTSQLHGKLDLERLSPGSRLGLRFAIA